MENHIIIIGGGLAGWATACAFADNNYSIDLFEGNNRNFGSQQISPNGWNALSKLIDINKVRPFFEKFNIIKIKSLNSNQKLNLLSSHNIKSSEINYGSVERSSIIKLLKDKVRKTNLVKVHSSNINYIISNNGTQELVDDKGNTYTTKFIIGADGINGVTRKFVSGFNNSLKMKKVYRSLSFREEPYKLTKGLIQLIFTSNGHFVIYPTIIEDKKATNYIFVPSDDLFLPPTIKSKSLNFLIPHDIKWEQTLAVKDKGENSAIHKSGVLLVGEASSPMPPHIAQAGNQILEDAVFIKANLIKNNNLKKTINNFITKRQDEKKDVARQSIVIGKILSSKNLIGGLRDLTIQSIGSNILENILNPIWKLEYNE